MHVRGLCMFIALVLMVMYDCFNIILHDLLGGSSDKIGLSSVHWTIEVLVCLCYR